MQQFILINIIKLSRELILNQSYRGYFNLYKIELPQTESLEPPRFEQLSSL